MKEKEIRCSKARKKNERKKDMKKIKHNGYDKRKITEPKIMNEIHRMKEKNRKKRK